jgi:hypothetical protein
MKTTVETGLLAELAGEYVGLVYIESWDKLDGSKGYRYTDLGGNVYPVWAIGPDTKDVLQSFRIVLDSNARTIANENKKRNLTTYIVKKKGAA